MMSFQDAGVPWPRCPRSASIRSSGESFHHHWSPWRRDAHPVLPADAMGEWRFAGEQRSNHRSMEGEAEDLGFHGSDLSMRRSHGVLGLSSPQVYQKKKTKKKTKKKKKLQTLNPNPNPNSKILNLIPKKP
jgi:hypothetical protein